MKKQIKKGRYISFGYYWGRVEGKEFVAYAVKGRSVDSRYSLTDALVVRALCRNARGADIRAGRIIHSLNRTHVNVGCTRLTHAKVEQVARLLEEANA